MALSIMVDERPRFGAFSSIDLPPVLSSLQEPARCAGASPAILDQVGVARRMGWISGRLSGAKALDSCPSDWSTTLALLRRNTQYNECKPCKQGFGPDGA